MLLAAPLPPLTVLYIYVPTPHPVCMQVKAAEQWLCYMCCPEFHQVGLLTRRDDWDKKLQELFLNDHEMEYVSHLSHFNMYQESW